jgi:hypothetical protein
MDVICQTCQRPIADDEPRYEYEGAPLCAPCATPAEPADDLASLAAARSRPRTRSSRPARYGKKRTNKASPVVLGFVGVCSVAMTAGTIYLIKHDFFREKPAPKVIIETVPAVDARPPVAPNPARA